MQGPQFRSLGPCRQPSLGRRWLIRPHDLGQLAHSSGRSAVVRAGKSFFGGDDKSKEEAAKKALQDASKKMGGAGKPPPGKAPQGKVPPVQVPGGAGKPASPAGKAPSGAGAAKDKVPSSMPNLAAGGGFGGFKGGPGGGGGGGGGGDDGDFFSRIFGDDSGGRRDPNDKGLVWNTLLFLRGAWTTVANAGIFLAFAWWMHSNLDWFSYNQWMVGMGAGRVVMENLTHRLMRPVEWVQRALLGWQLPLAEHQVTAPKYRFNAVHAADHQAEVWDQYRYDLGADEKAALVNTYVRRHWEREGGFRGDVDPAQVAAIQARLDPEAADIKEWKRAREQGTLKEYWAARPELHRDFYERGSDALEQKRAVAVARAARDILPPPPSKP